MLLVQAVAAMSVPPADRIRKLHAFATTHLAKQLFGLPVTINTVGEKASTFDSTPHGYPPDVTRNVPYLQHVEKCKQTLQAAVNTGAQAENIGTGLTYCQLLKEYKSTGFATVNNWIRNMATGASAAITDSTRKWQPDATISVGNKTVPVQNYVHDLDNFIRGFPVLEQDMIVSRGLGGAVFVNVATGELVPYAQHAVDLGPKMKYMKDVSSKFLLREFGFMSTSASDMYATGVFGPTTLQGNMHIRNPNYCYITMRITAPAGSHALAFGYNFDCDTKTVHLDQQDPEAEVLFPAGCKLKLMGIVLTPSLDDNWPNRMEMCYYLEELPDLDPFRSLILTWKGSAPAAAAAAVVPVTAAVVPAAAPAPAAPTAVVASVAAVPAAPAATAVVPAPTHRPTTPADAPVLFAATPASTATSAPIPPAAFAMTPVIMQPPTVLHDMPPVPVNVAVATGPLTVLVTDPVPVAAAAAASVPAPVAAVPVPVPVPAPVAAVAPAHAASLEARVAAIGQALSVTTSVYKPAQFYTALIIFSNAQSCPGLAQQVTATQKYLADNAVAVALSDYRRTSFRRPFEWSRWDRWRPQPGTYAPKEGGIQQHVESMIASLQQAVANAPHVEHGQQQRGVMERCHVTRK